MIKGYEYQMLEQIPKENLINSVIATRAILKVLEAEKKQVIESRDEYTALIVNLCCHMMDRYDIVDKSIVLDLIPERLYTLKAEVSQHLYDVGVVV